MWATVTSTRSLGARGRDDGSQVLLAAALRLGWRRPSARCSFYALIVALVRPWSSAGAAGNRTIPETAEVLAGWRPRTGPDALVDTILRTASPDRGSTDPRTRARTNLVNSAPGSSPRATSGQPPVYLGRSHSLTYATLLRIAHTAPNCGTSWYCEVA